MSAILTSTKSLLRFPFGIGEWFVGMPAVYTLRSSVWGSKWIKIFEHVSS